MPTLTPNYGWNLPLVNDPTDEDQWGGLLNANISSQDTIVKAISDLTYLYINNQTANYVQQASDKKKLIAMDSTGGNRTVTLLSAVTAGDGYLFAIKKTDSSANTVTITGTVDTLVNIVLANQNAAVLLQSDGAVWRVVSSHPGNGTNGAVLTYDTASNMYSWGSGSPGTRLTQSVGQAITGGALTALAFNTETWDDGNWHDNVTNNSRITVDFTGRVQLMASMGGVPIAAIDQLYFYKNGVVYFGGSITSVGGGNTYSGNILTEAICAPTDYFEFKVVLNSSYSTNILYTQFSARRVK